MATFTWAAVGKGGLWDSPNDWTLTGGTGTPPPGLTAANKDIATLGAAPTGDPYLVLLDGKFDIATLNMIGGQAKGDVTFLAIQGSLLTDTLAYGGAGGNAPINVVAEGLFDIRTTITAPATETVAISGTGAGGHLEFGSPTTSGISVNDADVTFDFTDAASGPSTGVIEWLSVPTGSISLQKIADAGWGNSFIFDGFNFTGDKFSYTGTTLTVKDSTNTTTVLTMKNLSAATGVSFLGVGNTIEIVCYARGTMLRTPDGELPVEKLRSGKQVITLVDGKEIPKTVTWLGHRRIDIAGHPRPETVAPIRILRDAIAEDMPRRDLVVSPDHAVLVDGKLICARQLVNGTTIRQEQGWTAVDYYHVELDQHAILVAEGLPAESYLDTGNSGFFTNSGAPLMLHPDLTDETDHPTREAGSCAPFVWDEASVQPVWQRLADRAAAIGQPVPQRTTTTDASLRLRSRLTGRRTIEPIYSDSNLVIFILPSRAQEVRLFSRAQSPTEARPWLGDRRHLGVRVNRIVLRSADELREIPVDHPELTRGWWAVERDGQAMSRWTDGEAVLPLPAMRGPVMLEIHLAGAMTFVVDAAPEGETERRAA